MRFILGTKVEPNTGNIQKEASVPASRVGPLPNDTGGVSELLAGRDPILSKRRLPRLNLEPC